MPIMPPSIRASPRWRHLPGGLQLLLKYGNNSIARGYSAGHSVHLKGCKLSRRGGASPQGAAEARIVRLEYEILNGVMEFNTNVLDFIR
jgi:hypothetical protein